MDTRTTFDREALAQLSRDAQAVREPEGPQVIFTTKDTKTTKMQRFQRDPGVLVSLVVLVVPNLKSLTQGAEVFMVRSMDTATALPDQQDRALARLLELGLAAAEKVQARLIATEDDALLGELSLALNRSSRNVRQTIALQMKVARERKRQDLDETALTAKADATQVNRRRAQVKATIERLIWNEAEGAEAERLVDYLEDRLNEEALYDDFTAQPVQTHIERLCEELGLDPPPQGEVSPKATEGVSSKADRPADFNPLTRSAGAPPEGEHLSSSAVEDDYWRSSG